MTFNISWTFEALDKFTSVSTRIARSVEKLQRRFTSLSKSLHTAGTRLRSIGTAFNRRFTLPVIAAGAATVVAAAKIEMMTTQFESMFHSAKKAGKFMEELQDFTAKTPFRIKGMAHAATTLLQMGFTAKNTIPTLRMLGDVTASHAEDLNQLSMVYGRVMSKGKLMYRDMYGLVNMQVPIVKTLQNMAKKAGHVLSAKQVWQAVQHGVASADDLSRAFKIMTSKGGLFYKHMELQSKTLAGRWSTFLDRLYLAAVPLGNIIADALGINDALGDTNDWLSVARDKLMEWRKTHQKLLADIKAHVGKLKNILFLVGAWISKHQKLAAIIALIAVSLGPILIVLGSILIVASILTGLFAFLLNPIVAIAIVIGLLYLKFKPVRTVVNYIVKHLIMLGDWLNTTFLSILKTIGLTIWHMITYPIRKAIAAFKALKGLFGGSAAVTHAVTTSAAKGAPQALAPVRSPAQRVESKLNISIHDPTGAVSNVTGKSTGGIIGFDLGTNMSLAGT